MGECELCGNEGSRLQINHKEHGKMMVCRECWKEVNEKGMRFWEGSCSRSSCSGCSGCK